MINVIFLLILYFLIAGTMVGKNELSFAPPTTLEAPDTRLPRPLLVLAPDGSLRLDGKLLGEGEWVAAAQAVARPDGGQLNLLAPADYPADHLVRRIAALGRASIPVRLVTVRPSPGAVP
jgi:biopolymer transport protein ExbD